MRNRTRTAAVALALGVFWVGSPSLAAAQDVESSDGAAAADEPIKTAEPAHRPKATVQIAKPVRKVKVELARPARKAKPATEIYERADAPKAEAEANEDAAAPADDAEPARRAKSASEIYEPADGATASPEAAAPEDAPVSTAEPDPLADPTAPAAEADETKADNAEAGKDETKSDNAEAGKDEPADTARHERENYGSSDEEPTAEPEDGVEPVGEAPDAADATEAGTDATASSRPASESASEVINWVIASGDNGGLPFVVIDKTQAEVFVFDAEHQFLGATPALLGSARGDNSADGVGDRELSAIKPRDRTTPAGRFLAGFGRAAGNRNVLWVDYASAISLHPVVYANKKERRLERLVSPTPRDNRITFGCINISANFYEKVVQPLFKGTSGVVYILPDTKPLAEVFPALPPPPVQQASGSEEIVVTKAAAQ